MKILITTDCYSPMVNGVVTSINNLRASLAEFGCDMRILTLSPTAETYERAGVYYLGSHGVGKIYPGVRMTLAAKDDRLLDMLSNNTGLYSYRFSREQFGKNVRALYTDVIKKQSSDFSSRFISRLNIFHTISVNIQRFFCARNATQRSFTA